MIGLRTTDQEQIRRLAGQLSQLYADALQRNTGDAAGCGDLPFAALESILRDQIVHAAGRPPAKYSQAGIVRALLRRDPAERRRFLGPRRDALPRRRAEDSQGVGRAPSRSRQRVRGFPRRPPGPVVRHLWRRRPASLCRGGQRPEAIHRRAIAQAARASARPAVARHLP